MKLITIDPQTARPSPLGSTQTGRADVLRALETASEHTGVSFDYLLKTATRESSLNPTAKAPTSSATGLFQFIEQTWLATVKKHGAAHGFSAQSDQIEQNANGRYKIADPKAREEILALRKDPAAAAIFAAAFTRDLHSGLHEGLGRAPTEGEVYSAHVMGLGGALKLIRAAEQGHGPPAADLFPGAAAANRSIFYAKGGAARSAAQVLAKLTTHHDGATTQPAAWPQQPREPAAASTTEVVVLRGPIGDDHPAPASYAGAGLPQAYILSPIMVQILASLDTAARDRSELGGGTQSPRA